MVQYGGMWILLILMIKGKFNEFVDVVLLIQDQIIIIKNGVFVVVLVGVDEWELLQEMLYWLV